MRALVMACLQVLCFMANPCEAGVQANYGITGSMVGWDIETAALLPDQAETLQYQWSGDILRQWADPNYLTTGTMALIGGLPPDTYPCAVTIEQAVDADGPWTCGSGIDAVPLDGAQAVTFDLYGLCPYWRVIVVNNNQVEDNVIYQLRIVFPRRGY